MPRKEMNNPTERIRRILEEIADLEYAYIQARDLLAAKAPELFMELDAEPNLINIEAERTRHHLTYSRAKWSREAMRRLRSRGEISFREPTVKINRPKDRSAGVISHRPHKLPDWRRNQGITPEIEQEIDKEVEKFIASGLKTWQPNSKCPATNGPCPMESEENCVCLHPELR